MYMNDDEDDDDDEDEDANAMELLAEKTTGETSSRSRRMAMARLGIVWNGNGKK